jgi:hypothetical protein
MVLCIIKYTLVIISIQKRRAIGEMTMNYPLYHLNFVRFIHIFPVSATAITDQLLNAFQEQQETSHAITPRIP